MIVEKIAVTSGFPFIKELITNGRRYMVGDLLCDVVLGEKKLIYDYEL